MPSLSADQRTLSTTHFPHTLDSSETARRSQPTPDVQIHGGIRHWIRSALTQWQEQFLPEKNQPKKTADLANNFRLIDVLADLSQRLLADPDLLIAGTQEKKDLEALLKEQISAFVAEELGLPYHSYANVVDIPQYIATGHLDTFHPRYANTTTRGDLLTMATRAAEVNTGAEGDRYQLEKKQLESLYHEKFAYELEHWQDPGLWQPSTVGTILSPAVRHQYGLSDMDLPLFVGNKYALVMPENSQVYPEGKAYTNVHQLVFIPEKNLCLVLIEQWFDSHTYADQAAILNTWQPNTISNHSPLTEKTLMSALVSLPEEVKTSSAFEVFADMTRKLNTDQSDISFRLTQQSTLGLLHASKDSIEHASTFLTQVLIAEYLVCLEHPEALQDLPARLWGAYEMMAHPFLTGEQFQYAAARAAYMDGYLQRWISTAQQTSTPALLNSARRHSTHQKISSWMENRAALHQPLSKEQQKQRNDSLQNYASLGYPQILQRVASQAWCATGSVGGLTQFSQTMNSSLGQSVLNGHMVSHSELAQMIGTERAQQWTQGVCMNPECARGTATQLIGECGFCIHCELMSQAGNMLSRRDAAEQTGNSLDSLNHFANRSFASPDDIASFYRDHFRITVDVLPAYIVGGDQVLR